MDAVAVIPARGGSKAIPGKNLGLAAGKPLLAWTAEAALASRRLGRVVLSTDDPAIARAGRELGLEVPFLRPAELARDDTPMLPVLIHALDHVARPGREPDALVLLQPTSPLRRAEHIDGALRVFEETGADTVVSVVEVPHRFTPSSLLREEHGFLRPLEPDHSAPLRRQDKPRLWARNGPAVLAVRPGTLRAGTLYGKATRGYVMGATDSLDVDTPEDLALADLLLRARAPEVNL